MNKNVDLLINYLDAIKRYPWHALIVAVVLSLLGWVFVSMLPNQYEATSRLHLSNESMMGPLLKGLAAESNLTSEMASLMRRTLINRPNLEKVLQSTDIGLVAKTPREKESLLRDLGKSILVEGDAKSKIFKIRFVDENPQIVRNVVQALTDIFIQDSLGATRKDAFAAQRFLNKEIGEYEVKLAKAENKLKEFKQKNIGLMPADGENYFTKLNQATSGLQGARLELSEAKKRLGAMRVQYSKEKGQRSLRQQEVTVTKEINAIKAKLDKLRSQYTEKHPDITFYTQQLSKLYAMRDTDGTQNSSSNSVPLSQESRSMDIALGKANGDVAALKVRVATFEMQLSGLRDRIDVIPGVEAELAQLNRDYGVIKKTYEGLVQRREAALLADQAEMSADSLQFRVIEYPVVPILPVSPNRYKWITLIFLGSIAAGLGTSVLFGQLMPIVSTTKDLKQLTGLPVLGSVSMAWSDKQKSTRYQTKVILGTAWALLLVAYAGLMILQAKNTDTLALFKQLTGGAA
jgi:polysaccharide chain length determinant protein (PEP-CTERM system associated)